MVDAAETLGHVAKNNIKLRRALAAMLTELDHIIAASEGTPKEPLLAINRRAYRAEQVGAEAIREEAF